MRVRLGSGLDFAPAHRGAREPATASEDDLAGVVVDGTGSTLPFPGLDAGISVPGLLESFLGPMERTRREARTAASRRNGVKGGRPRTVGVG